MLRKSSAWKWVRVLAVIGMGLALYLLYNYYAPHPSSICDLSGKVNCGAVSRGGTLALFLGIPVAAIGLCGYITIFISTLVKKAKFLFAMATFGMLFCLRMTILEIFVVKVYCPICMACQVVMLLAFLLSLFLLLGKSAQATDK